MGVPGLWDVIRPASQQRSLVHLSVHDGFLSTKHSKRGYRIGIDASIWFFHAHFAPGMDEGENPELRMLFFRLAKFLALPLLPLFVFDGPDRPRYKRNKRVVRFQHPLTASFKEMIEAFGFEWHHAPGEAEAELAFLNRIEVIDAVLSDDVDNFLFGATLVMRNPSPTLSGNRKHQLLNTDGLQDNKQVLLFSAKDILKHPQIQLTHGGFILIGLMKGGDYDTGGLNRAGLKTSHGLARAGFGDTLLELFHEHNQNPAQLSLALSTWRHNLREYLRKDPDKLIGKKMKALAASIPETFPPLQVLKDYAQPVTSEWREGARIPDFKWAKQPSLVEIANFCERHYEWGVKPLILKRFRTTIWNGALMRVLRASVMEGDRREMQRQRNRGVPQTPSNGRRTADFVVGTPSKLIAKTLSKLQLQQPPHHPQRLEGVDPFADDYVPEEVEDDQKLLVKVHSKRVHASTDGVLEYGVEMNPVQFVRITEEGLLGLRREDLSNVDNFGRRRHPVAAGNGDAPVQGGRAAQGPAGMDMNLKFDFGLGIGTGIDLDDEELAVRAAMRASLADAGRAAAGGGGAGAGAPGGRAPEEPVKPEDPIHIWVPACMLEMVEPVLVEEFETIEDSKEQRKMDKEERVGVRAEGRERPKNHRARGANANSGIAGRGKGTSKSTNRANSALIPDAKDEDEMDDGDDDDDNTETETELEPASPSKVKGKGKAVDRRNLTTRVKLMNSKSKSNSKPAAIAKLKGKGKTKTASTASSSTSKPKAKPPPFDIPEVLNNSDEDDDDREKDDEEDITDGSGTRHDRPPTVASRFPLNLNRAVRAMPVPTAMASYTASTGVDKTRTQIRAGVIVESNDSASDPGNESSTKQAVGRSGKTGKSAAIASPSLSFLSRTASQPAQPSQRNRLIASAEPSSSSTKVIQATKVTNSRKAAVPTSASTTSSRIKKTTRSTTRETVTNTRRFLFSMPSDVHEDGSVGTEGEEKEEEQLQDVEGEDDDVLDPYVLLCSVYPTHSMHPSQVTRPSNLRTQSEPKKDNKTNRITTTTRATYLSTNTRTKSSPSRIKFNMDLGDDSMAQDDADATVGPEDFRYILAGISESPVKESYSPAKGPIELIPTKSTSKASTTQPKAKPKSEKLFFSERFDESNNSDTGSEASASLEQIRQAAAKKKDKSKPPTIGPRLSPPTATKKRGKVPSGKTKGPRKSIRTTAKATSTSTSVSTKSAYLPTIATKQIAEPRTTRGSTDRSTPVIDLLVSDDEESSSATRAPAKLNPKSKSTKAASKSATSTNATVVTKTSRKPQVEIIDLLTD